MGAAFLTCKCSLIRINETQCVLKVKQRMKALFWIKAFFPLRVAWRQLLQHSQSEINSPNWCRCCLAICMYAHLFWWHVLSCKLLGPFPERASAKQWWFNQQLEYGIFIWSKMAPREPNGSRIVFTALRQLRLGLPKTANARVEERSWPLHTGIYGWQDQQQW